jgi:hypothetical protein
MRKSDKSRFSGSRVKAKKGDMSIGGTLLRRLTNPAAQRQIRPVIFFKIRITVSNDWRLG